MTEQEPKPDIISPIQRDIVKKGVGQEPSTFNQILTRLKNGVPRLEDSDLKLTPQDLSLQLGDLEARGFLERRFHLTAQGKQAFFNEQPQPTLTAAPIKERRILAGPVFRRMDPQVKRKEARVEKRAIAVQPPVQEAEFDTQPAAKVPGVGKDVKKLEPRLKETKLLMIQRGKGETLLFVEGDENISFSANGTILIKPKNSPAGIDLKVIGIDEAVRKFGYSRLSEGVQSALHRLSR